MAKLPLETTEIINQLKQELLIQTTHKTQNRLPAWQQSIKEVKLDWNLS
jgi:hypothetical protein